jgi:hypothetical protein
MVETANPKVMAALENKIAKLADEKLLLTDKLSQSNNPNGTLDEIIKLLRNYPAIHWNVCENGSLLVKTVILKTAFAAPLGYARHNGYRTPQVTIILHLLRKSHQNVKWCGRRESNSHECYLTATSTLRVYQFRHGRMPSVVPDV